MRACSVCKSGLREQIDAELLKRGNRPNYSALGCLFAMDRSAIFRHKRNGHVKRQSIAKLPDASQPDTETLLDELVTIKKEFEALAGHAKDNNQTNAAINAVEKRFNVVIAQLKMAGMLSDRPEHKHLHLNVDEATLRRVAETYLERHKLSDGSQNI